MEVLDSYEINDETIIIEPYDIGKSKVYEYEDEFIVNMIPLTIVKNSCLFFGATYEGRKEASKDILGIDMKAPIIVEETRNIIFFPVNGCLSKNSLWISYQNLLKYSKVDSNTSLLYFKGSKSKKVNVKYNLIDNQIIRCIKLDTLLLKRRKFTKRESTILDN